MHNTFGERIKRAWNVFMDRISYNEPQGGYYYRPDRIRLSRGNERSIVTAIYNRIAMDAASVDIRHVRLDRNDRYLETVDSGLNNCLSLSANIDQTGQAFVQDMVLTMLDNGAVAVVPVDTDIDPDNSGSYIIETMRCGVVTEWYPQHVKVKLWNDKKGKHEEVVVSKKTAAIIQNPFFSVMNEPNSTIQRLIRKLNLLDAIDNQSGSGKLDIIVQLPYVIKTEARRQQAEQRREEIERQLAGSKYGIAYADGTEKITQLNRPVDNNLMHQIEFLTKMAYSQLGIDENILSGSADEKTMLNYYNRIVEPILDAIVNEFKRTFLTKTARTQKQSLKYFRDPFKLVPVAQLAEIADKMTRNEIMTANEVRQTMGMKPSDDPKADELRNSNIRKSEEPKGLTEQEESQNEETLGL